MNIQFEHELKSKVKIKALDVEGLVVGYFYGENGKQFQVSYFLSGERKVLYLYPEEISKATGTEKLGFLKNA